MKVKPSSELTPQERDELAKYLPKGIDVNTMADCFYLVSQNFTAIQEKYGKVEPWRIDAHQVKNFLQTISDFDIKTIKLKQMQIISVDRALFKPSNKWRLAKALAHLILRQNKRWGPLEGIRGRMKGERQPFKPFPFSLFPTSARSLVMLEVR